MGNKKIDLTRLEECYLIGKYVEFHNLNQQKIALTEYPITCVTEKQLGKGQSIPDAIIKTADDMYRWIELTTFSRCQEMRKRMGEMRKFPERFRNQRIIPGISSDKFESLESGFYEATKNKIRKDYSQFAQLLNTQLHGTLIVAFINEDPFFGINEYQDFLSKIQDKHVLRSWKLKESQFNEIVFGTYVNTGIQKFQFELITKIDK